MSKEIKKQQDRRFATMPVVRELLEDNKESLAQALPKHIDPQRLMRVVLTGLTMNPTLQKCTTQSLMASLLRCALYGLEPDGVEAALVPFWDNRNKVFEAQLQPMYQGVIKLARQSGEITLFYADIIHEKDEFFMQKGTDPKLDHKPLISGDRGEPLGAYAVFKFRDSNDVDFEYMIGEDIRKIRDQILGKIKNEAAKKYSPWVAYELEMWKKTVIKRLAKRAPKSFQLREVLAHDNRIEGSPDSTKALDRIITDGASIQGLPEPEPDIEEPQALPSEGPQSDSEGITHDDLDEVDESQGLTTNPPVAGPSGAR